MTVQSPSGALRETIDRDWSADRFADADREFKNAAVRLRKATDAVAHAFDLAYDGRGPVERFTAASLASMHALRDYERSLKARNAAMVDVLIRRGLA